MKLFQQMLVASASLGLITPMAAQASDVLNLDGMNDYNRSKSSSSKKYFDSKSFDNVVNDDLATLKSSEQGLAATQYDFEAGGFSETTTASFSADFAIGDAGTTIGQDPVQAVYGFQIDLNTSFTGEDSLDISIDAGNGGNGLSELDLNEGNSTDDVLAVDGVAYTFPLAGATVFVGDNMDGSTLYNTACVYGGPTNNLDDCGNGNSAMAGGAGTAAGASYEFGEGFAVALGYTGDGSSSNGLMTSEGNDTFGGQLSYTADSYGASFTYANTENYSSTHDRNFYGLNGYWTPDETGFIPSVSVGYEIGDAQGLAETSQWFVGLQWDEAGPGTFGAALGTIGASTDKFPHLASTAGGDPQLLMYEAFYSYEINDGMTITPLIYVKEKEPANKASDEETGIMVKTSFSF